MVRRIPAKGEPQDLVEAEDWPDPGGFLRFPAPSVDAIAQLTIPEDGLYEIAIHDLYLSQRGDASLRYRLNIRRPRPDFRLLVSGPFYPDQVFAPRGLVLRAGGTATALVYARRIDGFQAPIFIEASSAPPGIRVEPIVIPAGQNQGTLIFRADDQAVGAYGGVRVIGRSRWRERKDRLEAVPDPFDPGIDVVREASVATTIWPSPNGQSNLLRLTRSLAACVLEPTPLKVESAQRYLAVGQGHMLPLDIVIERRFGLHREREPRDLRTSAQHGPATATIAKDKTSATIPLHVPPNVPPGRYTLFVTARGSFPFNRDPNAKDKPAIELTEVSAPIGLDVIAAPIELSVSNPNLNIPQGGEVEVTVNIARKDGFKGPVTLGLAAPGSTKLSASPSTIAFDQTSAKLKIRAAADAPPGPVGRTAVRALSIPKTIPIETDAVLAVTIVKK